MEVLKGVSVGDYETLFFIKQQEKTILWAVNDATG